MLFLLGYMGSGKSTLAAALFKTKGLAYVDLDHYIEKQENSTISEIFSQHGEIYFRKIESKYLNKLIKNRTYDVVALGGGTPCYANNMSLIHQDPKNRSVYLKVNLNTLSDRLFNEKSNRPLISHLETKAEVKDFVRKHLFEREYYYRQAKTILDVSQLSIGDAVKQVLKA